MQLNKSKLAAALVLPTRILGGRSTRVGRLLLEGFNSVFSIEAYGDDQFCRMVVDCDGDLPPTQVSPATFNNVVEFCDGEISITPEEGKLLVKSGSRVARIPTFADQIEKREPSGKPTVMPPEILAAGINCSQFCVPPDHHRPILHGVHVRCTDTLMSVESGDGANFTSFTAGAICGPCEFLLPSTFAHTVVEMLHPDSVVSLAENLITIHNGMNYYSCKLMDGEYIQTSKILEPECKTVAMISRDEWVAAYRYIKSMRGLGEDLMVRSVAVLKPDSCLIESAGENPCSQTIEGKFEERDLWLNAISFLKCLSLFPEKSTIELGHIAQFDGVSLKDGNLRVITTQLRK